MWANSSASTTCRRGSLQSAAPAGRMIFGATSPHATSSDGSSLWRIWTWGSRSSTDSRSAVSRHGPATTGTHRAVTRARRTTPMTSPSNPTSAPDNHATITIAVQGIATDAGAGADSATAESGAASDVNRSVDVTSDGATPNAASGTGHGGSISSSAGAAAPATT